MNCLQGQVKLWLVLYKQKNLNFQTMFFREQNDTVFELASMAVNLALWYTKHSAKFAAKEE